MKKSELIDSLHAADQKWEAFLDEIGPTLMEQPGVTAAWSMKDIVAHLTGWNQRLVARLQAAGRSEAEPPPQWPVHLETDDEINGWIYETNHGRTLRDVVDEMHQVNEQLIAVIEGLPEDLRIERVEPKYLLVWVNDERFHATEFFDHFQDDHEPDVRTWLERVENL